MMELFFMLKCHKFPFIIIFLIIMMIIIINLIHPNLFL